MEDANSKHIFNFLSKLVKHSLTELEYKQIGRLPKFFHARQQKAIEEYDLFVWPGYTCQVKLVNDGLFLNIDTCTKFL